MSIEVGALGLGLMFIFAKVRDHAIRAFWFTGHADVATVQYQPVMGVVLEFIGHKFDQSLFHLQHVLAGGNAGTVGDTKDMGVYCDSGFTKRGV